MSEGDRRSKNFSEGEMSMLLEEIEKNRGILIGGNLKQKGGELKKKQTIWAAIAKTLTAVTGTLRTWQQVRKKWHDTKTAVLKSISHEKGTGGGKPVPKSQYHDIVLRILGGGENVAVTGIPLDVSENSSSSEVPVVAATGPFLSLELPTQLEELQPLANSSAFATENVVIDLPVSFETLLEDQPAPIDLQSATRHVAHKKRTARRRGRKVQDDETEQLYHKYLNAGIYYYSQMAKKAQLEMKILLKNNPEIVDDTTDL